MRAADLSTRFDAPSSRCEWTIAAIEQHLPSDGGLRVLDLGCGTGRLLIELAQRRPRATLVGLDINAASVAAAREDARAAGVDDRIQFIVADYTNIRLPPFDLIVGSSVLQFIDADDSALFEKIASELKPDGLLIATMATASWENRSLNLIRRGLHHIRSPILDAVALAIASLVYGRKYPRSLIEQRIPYIYVQVFRLHGQALDRFLHERFGIALISCLSEARIGIGHMRHDLCIYRRKPRPQNETASTY